MSSHETRNACGEGIQTLCDWAAGTQLESIPDAVVQRAVRVLADDIAAIVGARDEPQVARVHASVLGRTAAREATVFRGGRPQTDRVWAAVANAVAADWLELDEGYRRTPCHAGLYTVPALLAYAEVSNLRFGEMLRALVLGYEIVTRVARTWAQRPQRMQSHGRFSAVGAAAATALAKGVGAEHLRQALTAAATLVTPSPRSHLVSGALVRNVWPAVGAWSGIMSVEWAEFGIGGVDDGFHDVYATVFGDEVHPGELTARLGNGWAILDGYTKMFACCQHLHSAIEAVLSLRSELADHGGIAGIEAVAVETHPLALALDNRSPTTTLGAKFSMPHAVAAALVTGTGGAEAFLDRTLRDEAIAGLREKVTMVPYDPLPAPPDDRPARVRVRLGDGQALSRECRSAEGGPDRPFPPNVLLDKVTALTSTVYPNLAPTLFALMDPARARAAGGWREIVGELCAGGETSLRATPAAQPA